MKFGVLLLINSVLAAVHGILFLVAAPAVGLAFGNELTLGGVAVTRIFGVSLLGYAMLTFLMRGVTDSAARKALVWTLLFTNGLSFVVALYNQLHHMISVLGWTTIVIYGLLAAGYAYFAFRKTA